MGMRFSRFSGNCEHHFTVRLMRGLPEFITLARYANMLEEKLRLLTSERQQNGEMGPSEMGGMLEMSEEAANGEKTVNNARIQSVSDIFSPKLQASSESRELSDDEKISSLNPSFQKQSHKAVRSAAPPPAPAQMQPSAKHAQHGILRQHNAHLHLEIAPSPKGAIRVADKGGGESRRDPVSPRLLDRPASPRLLIRAQLSEPGREQDQIDRRIEREKEQERGLEREKEQEKERVKERELARERDRSREREREMEMERERVRSMERERELERERVRQRDFEERELTRERERHEERQRFQKLESELEKLRDATLAVQKEQLKQQQFKDSEHTDRQDHQGLSVKTHATSDDHEHDAMQLQQQHAPVRHSPPSPPLLDMNSGTQTSTDASDIFVLSGYVVQGASTDPGGWDGGIASDKSATDSPLWSPYSRSPDDKVRNILD